MSIKELHRLFLGTNQVSTDTRKISPGCLFFALKGPNFNGNTFAAEALKQGAAYAVIDDPSFQSDQRMILVEDSLSTLQDLARYHRNHSKARIFALTGSNGKTTTKELLATVLRKSHKVVATKGNLNNHIGVPLTLLELKEDTEIGIIEMGANHIGEIRDLCNIALPDFGYITNFGKAHLEGFGSEKGVVEGKSELYRHIMDRKGKLFLNADDAIQKSALQQYTLKIGFSKVDTNYYIIKDVATGPYVTLEAEGVVIETKLLGQYNFSNCAVALLAGKYFNVPMEAIRESLENYQPTNNRSQVVEKGGYKIMMDAYNANPSSMAAALENFRQMQGENKTVILGDMFELGTAATIEHQRIADILEELDLENAFLVGKNFSAVQTAFPRFSTFEDLKEFIEKEEIAKGLLLIKGSRGMALERVLDIL